MKRSRSIGKIIIFLAIIAGLYFILQNSGVLSYLTNVQALQQWFQSLGLVGYAVFIGIYIFVAVFMLPASALTIAGGVAFGSIIGGILSIIGATAGATVALLISRYGARQLIVDKFGHNPLFHKIEQGFSENGISFLILTRLVPVFPYNLQNYAYGITSMKVSTFVWVSFFTMLPGSFIYAYLAGEIVENGLSVSVVVSFAVAGIALSLISLIARKFAQKKGIVIEKESE